MAGQTKRAKKTSNGVNKHKKNKQSPLALVLMGKGAYQSLAPVGKKGKA